MVRMWTGCPMPTRIGSLTILAQDADRWPGSRRLRWMQPRDGGLDAVRRALAYLGRYRREAVGAVVALLLVAAANLATPQLIRVAIDVGFTQAQPSALVEAVAGLVALAFVRGLFTFLQGYLGEERVAQVVGDPLR